ncbi:MAG: Crossover junction endodeoxyribonuclease ruvC [Marinimicrobia bacterium 46_43]|nr:MAG: Crossover junction endodeoxyribonuclease ruvC [Marinimicrobia bacterium 46_43]HBY18991.1 crossover junction endodeoxyribonuclease RuvC [Candidatus Neomarinimicrobiota bacterium]
MIILGIDPGLNTTGYGLIEYKPHHTRFIATGVIRNSRTMNFSDKLYHLYRELGNVIIHYKPELVIIEETYSNRNPRTSLLLGHARGVLMVAARNLDIPVVEYASRYIKKALTGNGGASKEQVRYMVMKLLKLASLPPEMDTSDALAIALTHCHHMKYESLMTPENTQRRSR